jgi:hypothetical protein
MAGVITAMIVGAFTCAVMVEAFAETCAGVILLMTCGLLMLSVIGAVCRGPQERLGLVGFAAFGWGYLALAHWYSYYEGPLPTIRFLLGDDDPWHENLMNLPARIRIAHYAWSLVFAVAGSGLTRLLFGHATVPRRKHATYASPQGDTGRLWRKPPWLALPGLALVAAALGGCWFKSEIGAETAFLLNWLLLGVAVLGAVCGPGRRREAWIGASSLGLGYIFVTSGPFFSLETPMNHFLNAVFRPDGPAWTAGAPDDELTTDSESRRIKEALERPVSLHFPQGRDLKIALEQIRRSLEAQTNTEFLFYISWNPRLAVHPGHPAFSVVLIDCENIPAKDALRLCLGQLGLTYRVHSGYVLIIPDVYQPIPVEEDPVLIGGHSLLALIAAAFGGLMAPIVAGLCGRHEACEMRPDLMRC